MTIAKHREKVKAKWRRKKAEPSTGRKALESDIILGRGKEVALYLVGTPIGNLEDITLRAVNVLRSVELIAAEDTRKTRVLLNRFEIKTPITSYYEHNKLTKLDYILGVAAEKDVALVSDAGMPGISDPGYELVGAAIADGIGVIPIPGPSAVISALAVSGLPTDQFTYLGFLPRRARAREKALQAIAPEPRTLVLFEAPHRLRATLESILKVIGNRRVAVCRELTKLHEEIFRGSVEEATSYFQEPKGEFTLVLEGAAEAREVLTPFEALKLLAELRKEGMAAREALDRVSRTTGMRRRELYRLWLKQP